MYISIKQNRNSTSPQMLCVCAYEICLSAYDCQTKLSLHTGTLRIRLVSVLVTVLLIWRNAMTKGTLTEESIEMGACLQF